MSSTGKTIERTDPVCGRQVGEGSLHSHVRAGMLFLFCSEACRNRFVAEPSRFALLSLAEDLASMAATALPGLGATVPAVETRPSRPAVPVARHTGLGERAHDEAKLAAVSRTAGLEAPTVAPSARSAHAVDSAKIGEMLAGGRRARPSVLGFMGWLLAWRERRFTAQCCRELLELHANVTGGQPNLAGPNLYRTIVMNRTGVDLAAANAVLESAEQSFTAWPVSRELTFRDIVHYLVVSEFVATHAGSRWITIDMKRVVHASIPQRL
jgi:YHS domain-containing protein